MAELNWTRRAWLSLQRWSRSTVRLPTRKQATSKLIGLGDLARDTANWAEAAVHYRAARKLDPNNAGLIVQLGHAHAECGDLAAAEQAYRASISLRPLHADTWLMLGHCLKRQSRLDEALEAYVRSHHLDPLAEDPLREIMAMQAAERVGKSTMINNSRLQRLIDDLANARETFEQLARNLPSLTSFASFAPANYDLYRKVHRWPHPPAADAGLLLSLDLSGWSALGFRRFLDSLARQSFEHWRLAIHVAASPLYDIAVLAAASDRRITLDSSADETAWQMILSPETVFDDTALAWFAWTIANTGATAVHCDDDSVDSQGVHRSPHLRGMFDAIADPAHPGLLVARQPIASSNDAAPVIAHIPLALASRFLSEQVPELTSNTPASWNVGPEQAGISVIIPTRDRLDLLFPCVESLVAKAGDQADFEIIIVDNGTTDQATSDYLRRGEAQGTFRVLAIDEPFNWARLNNLAARQAKKPLLLFLNNDTECLTDGWDRAVAEVLANPVVGVAGARLLYDDYTLQHAGIVFGFEHLAMHDGRHVGIGAPGPEGRWNQRRTASAVTGACLATPRGLFESLGGFDERRFAISYNDIDYCLRVRAAGKLVAYEPELTLLHHESKSRGLDVADAAKHQRDIEEARLLRVRWGRALDLEPSASPHWARFAPPFTALAMPSLARIMDHIRQSAQANPWLVDPADRA